MHRSFEFVTVPSLMTGSARRVGSAAPVVVGIGDGPVDDVWQALLFAAAEATVRHTGLVLVHGCEPLVSRSTVETGSEYEQRHRVGSEVVSEAAELIAQRLSDDQSLQVCVDPGTGARALEDLSEVAAMIVLQRRAVSAVRRWHTGSTTGRVAAHAKCPVVVVRGEHDVAADRPAIVVGVDDRGHAGAAVDVAFAEADLRRAELIAVHAWQPPDLTSGFIPPDAEELSRLRRSARAELAEALAGHGGLYPDVVVKRDVVSAPVVDALVQAAQGATLLVVGRHGSQRVGMVALGGVARQCMKEAPCPVMITPVQRIDRHPSRWFSREAPVGFGY